MKEKSIIRFYNYFAPFYSLIECLLPKQKRCLIEIINQLPQGKLLEIGIGSGSTLPFYKRHSITGIDLSTRMLALAKQRKVTVPVQLFVENGECTHLQNDFYDYVVINHVLSVTQEPNDMLQEAFRLLKAGGILFILNHFTPKNMLGYIDRAFAPVAKVLQFRSYFSLASLKAMEHFKLKQTIALNKFGYYRIIILTK